MSKSSPQVLGRVELMECARAIAVMVTRFKPKDIGRFYTAVDIAENLCQLPQGQLSTFHVATDTLKIKISTANEREWTRMGEEFRRRERCAPIQVLVF